MAMENNLKIIMRAVSTALQLDGSDDKRGAYLCYLQCIQRVAHLLLQDVHTPGFSVNASTKKCVQLGQQCMERLLELVDSLQASSSSSSSEPHTFGVKSKPANVQVQTSQIPQEVLHRAGGFSLPELPSPAQSLQSYTRRANEPTPMEIAQRKNQQLLLAYKKRMASISAKSPSATNMSLSLQRRMAENMAIARGREEALAKKVQERQRRLEEEATRRFASTAGMSKDEQERRHIYSQVLIYESDAKHLQTWRERLNSKPDDAKLIQDLILLVINTKDHPLTQLLTKMQYSIYDKLRPLVLSYIHELNRLKVPYESSPVKEQKDLPTTPPVTNVADRSCSDSGSGRSLSISSTDETLPDVCEDTKRDLQEAIGQNTKLSDKLKADVKQSADVAKNVLDIDQFDDLFEELPNEDTSNPPKQSTKKQLSLDAHDMDMVKDLASVTEEEKIENLKKDALDKHMAYITSDVREGMEKLSAMFIVAYDALDSAAGRDLCWSSLEEPFFRPLWPYLLALYRLGNYDKEKAAALAMTCLMNVSPMDIGVKEKFCPKVAGSKPFYSCIEELARLSALTSPLTKLESIVRLCKLLCQNMEENSSLSQSGSTQQITGADDLLPVLSYVIIHSRLPQLVAECHAMEEFIHEGYLMGEEGYCLTSLQTSLGYVISMSNPENRPDNLKA